MPKTEGTDNRKTVVLCNAVVHSTSRIEQASWAVLYYCDVSSSVTGLGWLLCPWTFTGTLVPPRMVLSVVIQSVLDNVLSCLAERLLHPLAHAHGAPGSHRRVAGLPRKAGRLLGGRQCLPHCVTERQAVQADHRLALKTMPLRITCLNNPPYLLLGSTAFDKFCDVSIENFDRKKLPFP